MNKIQNCFLYLYFSGPVSELYWNSFLCLKERNYACIHYKNVFWWEYHISGKILKVKVWKMKKCHNTCHSLHQVFFKSILAHYWRDSGLPYSVQSSPFRPNQERLTPDGVSWDQSVIDQCLSRWKTPLHPDKYHSSDSFYSSLFYQQSYSILFFITVYILWCICVCVYRHWCTMLGAGTPLSMVCLFWRSTVCP